MSYESYTNDVFLEMESLSPLIEVKPGDNIEHIEKWELYDNVPMPADDEAEIEKALAGRIKPN